MQHVDFQTCIKYLLYGGSGCPQISWSVEHCDTEKVIIFDMSPTVPLVPPAG